VPDAALKADYAKRGVISESEGSNYFTGDNVQLAIGQGLLSASPLQLAVGYSAIASKGNVLKPEIIKAIWQPGVPDSVTPGYADLSQAKLAMPPNVAGEIVRQIPMPESTWTEIDNGLHRVITGPGTNAGGGYRSTTGEKLFYYYPNSAIPISGKTGTAQGAGNYPWNDSSVFAAYSRDPSRPYTVTAYLEKSGYGSQAAAPLVKCMFLQMSGLAPTDPVELTDPLDTNSNAAASARVLRDQTCYNGRFDGGGIIE
jgi:penicillin-binding protein 2